MAPLTRLRVLVIEDDADARANLRDILEMDEHEVHAAATAAAALNRRDWDSYDVILLDWRLPDESGETLLPRLRKLAPEAAIIVATGIAGLDAAVVAMRHGAADYIVKPIDPELLRASLHRIMENRRLAMEKARTEAAFHSLVEAAGSMIVILHVDGTLAYMNPFGERLTDFAENELVGKNFLATFIDPANRDEATARFGRALEGHAERGYELPVRCREGATRWLLWNVQRLDDFDGQPAVVAIGQDITDRKQAQEKLLQAERLAAIGTAVTGLAHESRNAMQRSLASLELLATLVADNSEATNLIGRIQRAQRELHRLYEDVRQYAVPLRLQRAPCHLGQVLREAWQLVAHYRSGRSARLREEETRLDLVCEIDRFHILQAFRNILENSLAAAPDPVEVTVSYSETLLAGRKAIAVTMRDNGPGIPPEQCQRIFEEFYTTKTRGTGLGLAIVKRIVDAHGGQVSATPANGNGAEIVIKLPRRSLNNLPGSLSDAAT